MMSQHPADAVSIRGSETHPNVDVADICKAARHQRPILLRRATVISLDKTVGDLDVGDVLIQGELIRAVSADLSADPAAREALVVDLAGATVLPGFVDGHRHCWQGQFQHSLPDVDLSEYIHATHEDWAPRYDPEDIFVGTLLSTLAALNSGTTTVLDFAHNSRSTEHADAGFEAYATAGIRVVHASSGPRVGPVGHWPEDLTRLRDRWSEPRGSICDVRLGVFTPHRGRMRELVTFARRNSFAVSIDAVAGRPGSDLVVELDRDGLLGSDVNLIHCTGLNDAAWSAIASTNTSVTLTPSSDALLGLGDGASPINAVLNERVRGSLSTDVETSLSGDMVSEMRTALIEQRRTVQAEIWAGRPAPQRASVRSVLELATVGGADVVGISGHAGSIAPGRVADLVVHRPAGLFGHLHGDAIGRVVLGGHSGLVEAVLVAGAPRKWAGALVGVNPAGLERRAEASLRRLTRPNLNPRESRRSYKREHR